MARLGAIGTGGDFTTAGTWGVIDTTAAWAIDSEAGTLFITTSTSTHISPSATPGAITIDGVYLKISSFIATGTFTVVLRNTTAGSDVTSVVVNVADLPQGGWCFFKFSAAQTLLAATAYAIRVTCSVSTMVTLFRSTASAQEFTRLIRTTTNAAPGAGDQMIICKELTGQGTNSGTCTVTGDMTAATVYGATTYTDSLGVSSGGVFTWGTSASTNYLLTMKGLVTIWDGGTWNQGTSGTRIPSTSTAVLAFSVTTNVDSGFVAKNGAISNRYGNIVAADSTLLTADRGGYCTTNGTAVTRIQGQSFTGLTGAIVINGTGYTISSVTNANLLVLTGSAGVQAVPTSYTHAGTATTLTVASTSGWAVGDTLGIASTSKTAADCEEVTILTVDSATQVTLSSPLTKQHGGTSPIQAEIIHFTRNVRVLGTSTSLQAYVMYSSTTVANDSYASFRYMGSNTSNKQGVSFFTTTGSYTAIGCIVKDSAVSGSWGFGTTGVSNLNNVSITYSHCYGILNFGIAISSTTTGTNITIDHCIVMRTTNNNGFQILDVGGTITNCTAVACGSSGFNFSEPNYIGTIQNLVAHSNASNGIMLATCFGGTVDEVKVWRNNNYGLQYSAIGTTISNILGISNSQNNVSISGGGSMTISTATFATDTAFPQLYGTNHGLSCNTGIHGTNLVYSASFGVVSGIYTTHGGSDFNPSNLGVDLTFVNCLFGTTPDVNGPTSMLPYGVGIVRSHNHNQVTGAMKRWERNGTAILDTVTYRTASPAETMTPVNATNKFRSSDTQPIAIDSGQTATVTVYVYKSAAYNGNQPRLIVRRNDAIGITSDTVLATCVGGTGSWIALSGTTAAATADGAFVCYVDCDGTAGTVSVDDWSVA